MVLTYHKSCWAVITRRPEVGIITLPHKVQCVTTHTTWYAWRRKLIRTFFYRQHFTRQEGFFLSLMHIIQQITQQIEKFCRIMWNQITHEAASHAENEFDKIKGNFTSYYIVIVKLNLTHFILYCTLKNVLKTVLNCKYQHVNSAIQVLVAWHMGDGCWCRPLF